MIYPRDLTTEILKHIDSDEILIIVGARQTGKTTLLKLLQNKLIKDNKKTVFFNLEDYDYLKTFNESPKNLPALLPITELYEKVFIFIDEIQYLSNPTNFLKYIFDEYKEKIKLIVSGSSAFYIERKFEDSLSGRKRIFWLSTLNFHEFLIFKNRDDLADLWNKKVNILESSSTDFLLPVRRELDMFWNEFSKYGSFPRIVLTENVKQRIELIKELVHSFIKKDISESGISNPDKFYDLLRILSSQIGNLVNQNELANILGISNTAVQSYIYVMRKSFHISLVQPFHSNLRKELTKMPKVYFYDVGFRNCLIKNFESLSFHSDAGQLFENMIYILLANRFSRDCIKFWRTQSKQEVDFIVNEKYGVEVKRNVRQFKVLKYKKFLDTYDMPLWVIYKEGEIPIIIRSEYKKRIRFYKI